MRKKNWLFMLFFSLILISVLLFFIDLQRWTGSKTRAEALSIPEARQLVEQRYKGEVTKIRQVNNQYVIEMERADIKYEVKLGMDDGEILAFTKKSGAQGEATANQSLPQLNQPSVTTEEKGKKQQTAITEKAAAEIALQEVNGTVDDIDLETTGDTSYYLVEIETAADKEALVQIHAITGKIISITWDD
jgi:uncharacterized membrane protein YkoI